MLLPSADGGARWLGGARGATSPPRGGGTQVRGRLSGLILRDPSWMEDCKQECTVAWSHRLACSATHPLATTPFALRVRANTVASSRLRPMIMLARPSRHDVALLRRDGRQSTRANTNQHDTVGVPGSEVGVGVSAHESVAHSESIAISRALRVGPSIAACRCMPPQRST